MRTTLTILATLSLLVAGLSGCGGASATQLEVLDTASADLRCERDELAFSEDRPHRKRVDGCGRTQAYVRHCGVATRAGADFTGAGYGQRNCRWVAIPEDLTDNDG